MITEFKLFEMNDNNILLLQGHIHKNRIENVIEIINTNNSQELLDYSVKTAVLYNRVEILKLLIDVGANVNSTRERLYNYPILFSDNDNIMKLLIDAGADINTQDENGHTITYSSI